MQDLISRQSAVDEIEERKNANGYRNVAVISELNRLEGYIMRLPSAHPEIQKRKEESAQNVPKEDLISRKAAIDAMSESLKRVFPEHQQIAEKCLKALPSAQPEPQWIPVSERLPESKHEDLEYPTVIVCCGDGAVTLACYYESTKEWGTGEYYDRIINPVAWMPLPEPYRAERRTDEGD